MYFKKNIQYDNFNHRISELIEDSKIILDVGCATGKLLEYLKENKNCQVFGVEIDADMAKDAKRRCQNIICVDIESCENLPFEKDSFDVIVLADVLEHLKRPDIALKKIRPYLKDNGCFLISIPNIAFFTVRFNLLFGNFRYTEYGVLDKSHLRFFTLKTARQLIEESGFKIIHLEGYNQVRMRYFILKPLGRIFRNFFATDFIIKAVLKQENGN